MGPRRLGHLMADFNGGFLFFVYIFSVYFARGLDGVAFWRPGLFYFSYQQDYGSLLELHISGLLCSPCKGL